MLYVKLSKILAFPENGHFFNNHVYFSRWHWSLHKNPNTWLVMSAQGAEVTYWLGSHQAFGVMDDFGNLVKVA